MDDSINMLEMGQLNCSFKNVYHVSWYLYTVYVSPSPLFLLHLISSIAPSFI